MLCLATTTVTTETTKATETLAMLELAAYGSFFWAKYVISDVKYEILVEIYLKR